MGDIRELQVKFKGDTTDFVNAMKKVNGETEKGSLSFAKLTGSFAAGQAVYSTVTNAFRNLGGFIEDSVNEAANAEMVYEKMNQTLRNSGKVTEEQITQLHKYAETMQYKTGIEHESIENAIAMLGTFKLTGGTINSTIPTLINLGLAYRQATGEAINLQDWAIKIGKAEALPELAAQLRRIGIVFSENDIAMMKSMDEEKRVQFITAELNKEFGGLSNTLENTKATKLAAISLGFKELKEKIGEGILLGLDPFITKIRDWVASDQGQAKIEAIGQKVGELAKKMSDFILQVVIPWVKQHWPEIKAKVEAVVEALPKVGQAIEGIIKAGATIATFVGYFVVGFGVVQQALGWFFSLPFIIEDKVNAIQNTMIIWGIRFGRVIGDTIQGAVDWFSRLPGRILGAIGDFGGLLYGKGQDLVRGLLNGIGSLASSIGSWFLDKIPGWIREPFKKALGIHSPSSVFAGFGVNIGEGLLKGLSSTEDQIKGMMTNIANPEITSDITVASNNTPAIAPVHITVAPQVGIYAGMPAEKRQIAIDLWREIVREARSQGVQLPQIGVVSQ